MKTVLFIAGIDTDVGKTIGKDAAEVGRETGKKAKETFTK